MKRSVLLQLRIIGESYATVNHSIRDEHCDFPYFKEVAERMYPSNNHRRSWALHNMELFYTQEAERLKMWRDLAEQPAQHKSSKSGRTLYVK